MPEDPAKTLYLTNPRRVRHDVQLVRDFQEKFNQPLATTPAADYKQAYLEFRLRRIRAELTELEEALEDRDLVGIFDALLDLRYLVLGTEVSLGLPSLEGFEAVHLANMTKQSVPLAAASPFGSTHDVVKPSGFVPPEATLHHLLHRYGWGG